MKTLIIFASKYGSTKQYAEWLSKETGYDAVNVKELNIKRLQDYDRLIIGSSVHVGRLDISNWIKRHWDVLSQKIMILFSVNGTPPEQKEELQKILEFSLPKHMLNKIHYFPLQGRLIFAELSFWHKILLKLMKKMDKHPDNNLVLEDFDNVKKENLENLREYILDPVNLN